MSFEDEFEVAALDRLATNRQIVIGKNLDLDLTGATYRSAGRAIAKARRDKILAKKGLSVGSKISYGEKTGTIERGVAGWNVRVRWDKPITASSKRFVSVSYVSPNLIAPL